MENVFGPKNAEEAQIFAIEELIVEVQHVIQTRMVEKQVTRAELARRLGCKPAWVTQLLSEDSNLTLETVAKVFFALGEKCKVRTVATGTGRKTFDSAKTFDDDERVVLEHTLWAEEKAVNRRTKNEEPRPPANDAVSMILAIARESFERLDELPRNSNQNESNSQVLSEIASAA